MSTQHPDNVHQPFFVENTLLGGEDEIQEAFYAFSHLGCDEQLWDFEGKEVDTFVVKKLLSKNEQYFKTHRLGQDVRLTFRVPNPEFEHTEAKILLETLESIPRSFDAAKAFYGEDVVPIYEIILPMTTSVDSLNRVYYYYRDIVAGKENMSLDHQNFSIRDWIGEFYPKLINVVPLFEDKERLLQSSDIVRSYLTDKKVEYQRVFLARSDPATNYGNVSAILLNKIALKRLYNLSQEIGIPIYPILGVGSAPFRGNFRPQTVEQILKGYPSVQTFTIQSSFKFDNPPDVVQQAIQRIQSHEVSSPMDVDERATIEIIEKYTHAYRAQLKKLVQPINHIASYIPKRRKRRLHTGLFGYSRSFEEMKLPRAITFTASMYSLGIPPELLALDSLSKEDIHVITTCYANFEYDILSSLKYYNRSSQFVPDEVRRVVDSYIEKTEIDERHAKLTSYISECIFHDKHEDLSLFVLEAAHVRGFLG